MWVIARQTSYELIRRLDADVTVWLGGKGFSQALLTQCFGLEGNSSLNPLVPWLVAFWEGALQRTNAPQAGARRQESDCWPSPEDSLMALVVEMGAEYPDSPGFSVEQGERGRGEK